MWWRVDVRDEGKRTKVRAEGAVNVVKVGTCNRGSVPLLQVRRAGWEVGCLLLRSILSVGHWGTWQRVYRFPAVPGGGGGGTVLEDRGCSD